MVDRLAAIACEVQEFLIGLGRTFRDMLSDDERPECLCLCHLVRKLDCTHGAELISRGREIIRHDFRVIIGARRPNVDVATAVGAKLAD